MKIQKTVKGFTAKQIIENVNSETRGGDYVSEIKGKEFIWNFRKTNHSTSYSSVCEPDEADCIILLNVGEAANPALPYGCSLVKLKF